MEENVNHQRMQIIAHLRLFLTSETLERMGTSFGCSVFWHRFGGQALGMIS